MSPSSRFLAKKMLEDIDFQNVEVIVELGPGTGVFTTRILEQMTLGSKLLVFELNENFFNSLQKKINDPRVILINDSAEKLEEYLAKYDLHAADVVVSSLPLANFPAELRNAILDAAHRSLNPIGKYVQFQYSLQSRKYIKRVFKQVGIKFTLANFPPAFVYTCYK